MKHYIFFLSFILFILPSFGQQEQIQQGQQEQIQQGQQEQIQQQELLISGSFFETDIREALSDIAAQAKVVIIADNTVHGFVTLDFKDIPLERALDMVLAGGGFVYKKMDGYYLVGKPDVDNPSFHYFAKTEYIKPNYLTAAQIKDLLSDFYSPYIEVDAARNIITASAPDNILETLKQAIAKIDRPPKQLVIETLVTEVSSEVVRELGLEWGKEREFWGITYEIKSKRLHFKDITAILKPFIDEGKVKIRASPRITTLDAQEAVIEISEESYYPIVTEWRSELRAISAGIKLSIIPYVSEEQDYITVNIKPEISSVIGEVVGKYGTYPKISRRHLNTTVRVKQGETIAIGGLLYKTYEEKRARIIPILSWIPILNLIFGKQKTSVLHTEVVIFITPTIE